MRSCMSEMSCLMCDTDTFIFRFWKSSLQSICQYFHSYMYSIVSLLVSNALSSFSDRKKKFFLNRNKLHQVCHVIQSFSCCHCQPRATLTPGRIDFLCSILWTQCIMWLLLLQSSYLWLVDENKSTENKVEDITFSLLFHCSVNDFPVHSRLPVAGCRFSKKFLEAQRRRVHIFDYLAYMIK